MGVEEQSKIEVAPEEWLGMGLSPAALDLLGAGMTSVQYADVLMAGARFEDTVRVLAHVLPAGTAVKWALSSIRQVAPASVNGSADGVKVIEAWLEKPSDERRRATFAAVEAAGIGTAVGSLGLAVFLSGGSIAPPTAPEVQAPPGVAARALAGALTLAAVYDEPQNAASKVRRFAEAGVKLLIEPKGKVREIKESK